MEALGCRIIFFATIALLNDRGALVTLLSSSESLHLVLVEVVRQFSELLGQALRLVVLREALTSVEL